MTRPTLYHGTPFEIDDTLRLPEKESHPGSGRIIFATPDLMCAIAYCLKPPAQENLQVYSLRIFTGQKKAPILMFGCKKGNVEEEFNKLGEGYVLELPNESFIPMRDDLETCEWKSEQEVNGVKLLKKFSAQDVMALGVQIFLMNDVEKYYQIEPSQRQDLSKLVEDGLLVHVNANQKINPMNLTNQKVENDIYINHPELITSPGTSPENNGNQQLQDSSLERV